MTGYISDNDDADKEVEERDVNVVFRDNASLGACGHVITRRCSGEDVNCKGAVGI